MRLYAGHTVGMILHMPAKTFLALLGEGHKLKVYEMKEQIAVATYPYLEQENRDSLMQSLTLPDDILSDIVIAETSETEKQQFKEALEDGDQPR